MSHVTVVDINIKDLAALKAACAKLGLEFCEGQTTFKWWGDAGKCDHAIRVKGKPEAYEVGVSRRTDGQEGFVLKSDFFRGGYGLQEAVGKGCSKLCQGYQEQIVLKHSKALIAKGFNLKTSKNTAGELVMRLTRG